MSLRNDQDPRYDLCSTIHRYSWGRWPEKAIQKNMHISPLQKKKASQWNTYFSATLREKSKDGKRGGFLKDETQQGCLDTARPGEHAGESVPRERLLKPRTRPDWRWVGRGKLTAFLLTPGKWQISLTEVLVQAFSPVIIKQKIMVCVWVGQSGLPVFCFLLSV